MPLHFPRLLLMFLMPALLGPLASARQTKGLVEGVTVSIAVQESGPCGGAFESLESRRLMNAEAFIGTFGDETAFESHNVGPTPAGIYLIGDDTSGIEASELPVTWAGTFTPRQTATYTFLSSDDQALTVRVDGQPVVVASGSHWGTINLQAGQRHDIEVDYHRATGQAAQLHWVAPGQPMRSVNVTARDTMADDQSSPRLLDGRTNKAREHAEAIPGSQPITLVYHVERGKDALITSGLDRAEPGEPVMLDWEAQNSIRNNVLPVLDPFNNHPEFEQRLADAHAILDLAEAHAPEVHLGFYGLGLPTPGRFNQIRTEPEEWLATVQQAVRDVPEYARLIERVDVLYPVMYFNSRWKTDPKYDAGVEQVVKTVCEAARLLGKEPYLVINADGYEKERFQQHVAIMLEHAAGVVVWSNEPQRSEFFEDLATEVTDEDVPVKQGNEVPDREGV